MLRDHIFIGDVLMAGVVKRNKKEKAMANDRAPAASPRPERDGMQTKYYLVYM